MTGLKRDVTPAKAGVQKTAETLDSRFHGNDVKNFSSPDKECDFPLPHAGMLPDPLGEIAQMVIMPHGIEASRGAMG